MNRRGFLGTLLGCLIATQVPRPKGPLNVHKAATVPWDPPPNLGDIQLQMTPQGAARYLHEFMGPPVREYKCIEGPWPLCDKFYDCGKAQRLSRFEIVKDPRRLPV